MHYWLCKMLPCDWFICVTCAVIIRGGGIMLNYALWWIEYSPHWHYRMLLKKKYIVINQGISIRSSYGVILQMTGLINTWLILRRHLVHAKLNHWLILCDNPKCKDPEHTAAISNMWRLWMNLVKSWKISQ